MLNSATTNWDLGGQWAAWRSDHPQSNLREDAHGLGVSPMELVATGVANIQIWTPNGTRAISQVIAPVGGCTVGVL